MITVSQLAEQFGISDRQTRKYIAAIRIRHTEIAGCRGKYPDWIADEIQWIQRWGLATYIAGGDRAANTDNTDTTAIATPDTTPETTPDTTTAIAPITPVTIVPCAGEGATQAIDALEILESRLSQAEQMLAERSQILDDRARQRQQAIQNIARRAAQLEAQSIALDRREILEQILDSEAGKFANLAVG